VADKLPRYEKTYLIAVCLGFVERESKHENTSRAKHAKRCKLRLLQRVQLACLPSLLREMDAFSCIPRGEVQLHRGLPRLECGARNAEWKRNSHAKSAKHAKERTEREIEHKKVNAVLV